MIKIITVYVCMSTIKYSYGYSSNSIRYIPDLVCTREEVIYTRYQVITTVWIEMVRRVAACMSVR